MSKLKRIINDNTNSSEKSISIKSDETTISSSEKSNSYVKINTKDIILYMNPLWFPLLNPVHPSSRVIPINKRNFQKISGFNFQNIKKFCQDCKKNWRNISYFLYQELLINDKSDEFNKYSVEFIDDLLLNNRSKYIPVEVTNQIQNLWTRLPSLLMLFITKELQPILLKEIKNRYDNLFILYLRKILKRKLDNPKDNYIYNYQINYLIITDYGILGWTETLDQKSTETALYFILECFNNLIDNGMNRYLDIINIDGKFDIQNWNIIDLLEVLLKNPHIFTLLEKNKLINHSIWRIYIKQLIIQNLNYIKILSGFINQNTNQLINILELLERYQYSYIKKIYKDIGIKKSLYFENINELVNKLEPDRINYIIKKYRINEIFPTIDDPNEFKIILIKILQNCDICYGFDEHQIISYKEYFFNISIIYNDFILSISNFIKQGLINIPLNNHAETIINYFFKENQKTNYYMLTWSSVIKQFCSRAIYILSTPNNFIKESYISVKTADLLKIDLSKALQENILWISLKRILNQISDIYNSTKVL